MSYEDRNGYLRDSYGDLIHRSVAYQELYKSNDYDLPFRELDVHHIDTNKKNNNSDNLLICSREDHDKIHKEQKNNRKKFKNKEEIDKFLEGYELKEFNRLQKEHKEKMKKARENKEYECGECGRAISHRGNCLPCNTKLKKEREERLKAYHHERSMKTHREFKQSVSNSNWMWGLALMFFGYLLMGSTELFGAWLMIGGFIVLMIKIINKFIDYRF